MPSMMSWGERRTMSWRMESGFLLEGDGGVMMKRVGILGTGGSELHHSSPVIPGEMAWKDLASQAFLFFVPPAASDRVS